MKTPRFLLGAALLFWGWQTDLLAIGALLAAVIESPRVVKERWELSDQDFSRIWTFCALLFFAAAVYAFTDNGGPETFHNFFRMPNYAAQRHAGLAAAHTAGAIMHWLPMLFFLFVAAQEFSADGTVPAATISRMLRLRWRGPKKSDPPPAPGAGVNIAYPYFGLCLFAASIHPGQGDTTFFWGSCALIIWALWPHRSRRFGIWFWSGAVAVAIAVGFFGQRGIIELQHYFEALNPSWFTRLLQRGHDTDPTQSHTWLGEIGRMKTSGEIVIRLAPEIGSAPPYLREASYRNFNSPQVWSAGRSENDFQNVLALTNQTTWIFLSKTNTASVKIACYLSHGSGLLPLPEGCGRLENLPAYIMQTNSAGTVVVQGPGLVIFDALYSPGASIDSPPDGADWHVPPNEGPALGRVVSDLNLWGKTNLEEALPALRHFFAGQFAYRLWQNTRPPKGETPLAQFLLHTHAGHCEYFATATVLLLREIGIPARYAVGYAVHEKSGKTGYVVRARDAHAWCIAWDEGTRTWRDFDTTPASWIKEEDERASPFQWLGDAWSWVKFQISKLRWGQGHFREFILLALVPVLMLLFIQIIRNRRRQRQNRKETGAPMNWPGLDSEFFQIERKLAARGVVRAPAEPLSGWLERAGADLRLAEFREPLRELLHLHYRYRFDPPGLSEPDREALRREAKECLQRLSLTERTPAPVAK